MKKTIALVLALLMMSACTAFAADDIFVIAPNPMAKPNTLDIQIITPEGQLVWTTAPIEGEDTVLNVVQRVLKEREIPHTVEESPYGGNYITVLNGWAEGAYGGYEGCSRILSLRCEWYHQTDKHPRSCSKQRYCYQFRSGY